MNVLVLGSGGREHALAWKIAQSSMLTRLYVAPGNAGTSSVAENVDLDPMDFKKVADFCLKQEVKIVVVGPEAPLVKGISDFFSTQEKYAHITVIGPSKNGAQLEGSKAFAKKFMGRHNIPTARYRSFTLANLAEAGAFLASLKPPYVIKADGLAAGKGVIITSDLAEAENTVSAMLNDEAFGEAGRTVVIEEFLKGTEVSVFVITDGDAFKMLPEAKDYKRIGDGDTGLNTGGMGAVSPVPFVGAEFQQKVLNQIIIPTVKGLKAENIDYKGFIFFGLIKVQGDPYVIEYNCRMGDPETEAIMPRIKSDLLHLFEGIASGTLSECDMQTDERASATVILASEGYPGSYPKGREITIGELPEKVLLFHAGTKTAGGKVVTNGGRVLASTGLGSTIEEAIKRAYLGTKVAQFNGVYYRNDIGADLRKSTGKVAQKSATT